MLDGGTSSVPVWMQKERKWPARPGGVGTVLWALSRTPAGTEERFWPSAVSPAETKVIGTLFAPIRVGCGDAASGGDEEEDERRRNAGGDLGSSIAPPLDSDWDALRRTSTLGAVPTPPPPDDRKWTDD